jgi:hypothetical protein
MDWPGEWPHTVAMRGGGKTGADCTSSDALRRRLPVKELFGRVVLGMIIFAFGGKRRFAWKLFWRAATG